MAIDSSGVKMKNPTAGVILAAGMSTRMGHPKQFIKISGKTMLEIAVNAALTSKLEKVVVVLGQAFDTAIDILEGVAGSSRLVLVHNKEYHKGLSRSLHVGLRLVHEAFPSVMFLSADQPLVTSSLINFLLQRFWASDKDICVPVADGRQGLPTIFSHRFYPDLFNVTGDKGGRDVIRHATDNVLVVGLEDSTCLMDIDSPSDLEALKALTGLPGNAGSPFNS